MNKKNNINPYHTFIRLQHKYSQPCIRDKQHLHKINAIVQGEMSSEIVSFMEIEFIIKDKEYLKRQYTTAQFKSKIQAIAEYYRFQLNMPWWFHLPIQKIMKNYQEKINKAKRKQIKHFMKENHGVSITSVHTFSSCSSASETPQSKYSTKLSRLNSNRTSLQLENICNSINDAFKNIRVHNFYKGKFPSKENSFRKFLIKQKKQKIQKQPEEHKFDSNQQFQRKYKARSTNNLRKKIQPKQFSKTIQTVSRDETNKFFRKRKIKNMTKSLPKIFSMPKTEARSFQLKKEPKQLCDKSLNYLRRRITTNKTKKQNEDNHNRMTPSLTRFSKLKKSQNDKSQKSRKVLKGFRPSSAHLKPSPFMTSSHQFLPSNQEKQVQTLIRKKLQIR